MTSKIKLKNQSDIALLRQAGQIHKEVLDELYRFCEPGVSLVDIDRLARRLVKEADSRPAFLNYQPLGAPRPFPSAVCISLNEEIVHGPANRSRRLLNKGDIVSVDLGINYQNRITDAAFTKAIGRVDSEVEDLIETTRRALVRAIEAVKAGCRVGDIGAAVEKAVVGKPYHIIKHLAGHGVGYQVHEPPFIPNVGLAGKGEVLPAGAVVAIEPMLALGSDDVRLQSDGFTYATADDSLSAHFEQTVLVTKRGREILTPFSF